REAEKRAHRTYRLPTEAEWEYACRGGSETYSAYHVGPTLSAEQANFHFKMRRTTPVDKYPPNAFGLRDMHGNVFQWCQDWYGFYDKVRQDPQGPPNGTEHVMRGGSSATTVEGCRSAFRGK